MLSHDEFRRVEAQPQRRRLHPEWILLRETNEWRLRPTAAVPASSKFITHPKRIRLMSRKWTALGGGGPPPNRNQPEHRPMRILTAQSLSEWHANFMWNDRLARFLFPMLPIFATFTEDCWDCLVLWSGSARKVCLFSGETAWFCCEGSGPE